ncbi:SAL1 phosphatase, partial [Bienertia sinuspersici]
SGDLIKGCVHDTLECIRLLINDIIASDEPTTVDVPPLSAEDGLAIINNGRPEGGSIDGGKRFVRGNQHAIALALLDQRKVVPGVLACLNLPLSPLAVTGEELIWSHLMVLPQSNPIAKVRSLFPPLQSNLSSLEEFILCTCGKLLIINMFHKKLSVKSHQIRIGSPAKYGVFSRGDGLYIRVSRFPHASYHEKVFDHAARSIVVTEVGGVIFIVAENPLDFSKGKYHYSAIY